jgi:hypothetical protein
VFFDVVVPSGSEYSLLNIRVDAPHGATPARMALERGYRIEIAFLLLMSNDRLILHWLEYLVIKSEKPKSHTPSELVARESRKSTRVRLKILIEVQGVSEPLTCKGETIVVNLHGALISTAVSLRVGMKVSVRVEITDNAAAAEVVYVDPDQPRHCGIKLAKPENIWGISLPPNDWHDHVE